MSEPQYLPSVPGPDWVMPNHVPIEPISAEQEMRATALTLAVEYCKGWTKPSIEDVFRTSDAMLRYIESGQYLKR